MLATGQGWRTRTRARRLISCCKAPFMKDASRRLRSRRAPLAPVHDELALLEVPRSLQFDETVEVAEGCDHDLSFTVLGEEMMSDRVGLAGRTVAIKIDGALTVEVGGRLEAVEISEDRGHRLAIFEDVGRLAA